ncbi:hypothetical protein ATO11_09765 [Pseudaestuariivita atlantica]|uniref:Exopolysaccharide biosynthesis protein n=1 Tax=Pseudaestuariivita atlantica TaxID=1317121 RepID=A0A0L1JQ65_9RHOB|nr:hypothetical protein ATO11_09765 [Pseudaestuariivita atlantica]
MQHVAEAARSPRVAISDVMRALGLAGGLLPVLMVLGLVLVSPLSGVPLLSSAVGLSIAVIAGRMLMGQQSTRLPEMLARCEMTGRKLERTVGLMLRLARFVDRITMSGRMRWLTVPPVEKVVLALVMGIGLVMPLMEFVPLSSSLLGAAVMFMALGLLVQDGLVLLLGLAIASGAALIPITAISTMAG